MKEHSLTVTLKYDGTLIKVIALPEDEEEKEIAQYSWDKFVQNTRKFERQEIMNNCYEAIKKLANK